MEENHSKRMVMYVYLLFAVTLIFGCQRSKELEVEVDQRDIYFNLDGFYFQDSYSNVMNAIKSRQFREIDRVYFTLEKDKEMYPIADLMITYEAEFFGEPVDMAFHFKNKQFQFLILQIANASLSSLIDQFTIDYGTPTRQGDAYNGETFQGSNILWQIYKDEEPHGYISLMPLAGAGSSPEDWAAIATIYPYSANPRE
ncbi:hypothetical protein PVA44_05725 [Entomospira nematocerorum]|uniref:Lipoprotein n=1 Tax=Entomospira nematocerorum TaxID=2719987 RepID=A0A968GCC5_9SPIO|nr:hypothetical protein [Entomospira nematocera]NIZ46482.1 hypothetical protein [Entomospira nematocera]WDI33717.1 hypothetical protein PVA44_05725 [Entomospira nematocera]